MVAVNIDFIDSSGPRFFGGAVGVVFRPTEQGAVAFIGQVQPKRYYQRARDSGTGSLVYWMTIGGTDTNPAPSTTNPNYTGTLSGFTVVRIISQ